MINKEAWVDIKSLYRQGYSIRGIARELGLSRKTVRRYLRSEDLPRYVRSKKRASLIDPYKDYLTSRLRGLPELPATVLLREITAQGYQGKITLVKDFVRPLRTEQKRLQELTVRFETPPGEQAQVDWGDFGRLVNGQRLYGLCVVLSWSRAMFVYFSSRMTLPELLYGLMLAFAYFGGLPKKLLFDNLKAVVLKRGKGVADSKVHPRFVDFLGHYGLALQLCQLGRARTKGKVERPMAYVEKSLVLPTKGRWQTSADANRDARVWLDEVANVRLHGTTGVPPFERLTKEGLLSLAAVRPFDLSWMEARRVHKDCHFSWDGNRYSVPWQYGLRAVLVRRHPAGCLVVEYGGEVIARHHERPAGQRLTITLPEHLSGLWHPSEARMILTRRSGVSTNTNNKMNSQPGCAPCPFLNWWLKSATWPCMSASWRQQDEPASPEIGPQPSRRSVA